MSGIMNQCLGVHEAALPMNSLIKGFKKNPNSFSMSLLDGTLNVMRMQLEITLQQFPQPIDDKSENYAHFQQAMVAYKQGKDRVERLRAKYLPQPTPIPMLPQPLVPQPSSYGHFSSAQPYSPPYLPIPTPPPSPQVSYSTEPYSSPYLSNLTPTHSPYPPYTPQSSTTYTQTSYSPQASFSPSLPNREERAIAERAQNQGYISFYDDQTDALTGCFGNFHACAIAFEGREYSNAETIFQSRKFTDQTRIFDMFTENTSGDQAVTLGQTAMSGTMSQRWDGIRVGVMMNVLRAKFTQNSDLKKLLLATGNAYLVEHLPSPRRDTFWSDAFNGSGGNNLGICLMKLREEFGGTGVVGKPRAYLEMLKHPRSSASSEYTSQGAEAPAFCQLSGCNREVYEDPSSGKAHPFCGTTHAREFQQLKNLQPGTQPARVNAMATCKLPGCNAPVFVESNGKAYDFCGKRHASQFKEQPQSQGGLFGLTQQFSFLGFESGSGTQPARVNAVATCKLPGCNKGAYVEPLTGRVHDYCGATHAKVAGAKK